jgi:hypothetical protein
LVMNNSPPGGAIPVKTFSPSRQRGSYARIVK